MVLWHVQVSDLRSAKEYSLAKLEIRVSSSPHTLLSTSTLYAVSLVFFPLTLISMERSLRFWYQAYVVGLLCFFYDSGWRTANGESASQENHAQGKRENHSHTNA